MAAAIALGVTPAFATTFDYSGYNVVNNQNVSITGPSSFSETGGSGQIVLSGTGVNSGQTLAVWCIDLPDYLQGSGDFTFNAPTSATNNGLPTGLALNTLSNQQLGEIGGLIAFGNANIETGDYDFSSATQIAVWTTEYQGTGYTVTGSAGANAEAAILETEVTNQTIAWSYGWDALTDPNNAAGTNQGQATPVPEPASLLLLGMGLTGMATLRRRKV